MCFCSHWFLTSRTPCILGNREWQTVPWFSWFRPRPLLIHTTFFRSVCFWVLGSLLGVVTHRVQAWSHRDHIVFRWVCFEEKMDSIKTFVPDFLFQFFQRFVPPPSGPKCEVNPIQIGHNYHISERTWGQHYIWKQIRIFRALNIYSYPECCCNIPLMFTLLAHLSV